MARLTFTKEFKKAEGIEKIKYLKPELLQQWEEKLAAFEDIFDTPEQAARAKAILNEGRFVYTVPCRLGQKVYYIHGNRVVKAEVTAIIINENGVEMELYFYIDGYYRNYVNESCIGKSVFYNRKDAVESVAE